METVKATVLGMIYFTRDKLVRNLVTEENFSTLWQVILQLEYFRIVWMNMVRSRKQQLLFSGSLYTIHNETPIGSLKSMKNIFHRSKFKSYSWDIFFWWNLDLLLINCSRCFLFEVWFLTTSKKYCVYVITYSEGNK